jgi:hypothetical protein
LSEGTFFKLNGCSEFSPDSCGTFLPVLKFIPHSMEEDDMKKLAYVIAAITAIAIAAPSIANAETVVIRHGHHDRGFHRDFHRDWHHGWHRHDRDRVVIKHRY